MGSVVCTTFTALPYPSATPWTSTIVAERAKKAEENRPGRVALVGLIEKLPLLPFLNPIMW